MLSLQQQPWVHLDNDTKTYLPTVFFNDFWTLRDYMVPVNDTVPELALQLNLNSVGPWKWMMYLQMEQSFSMQVRACTGGWHASRPALVLMLLAYRLRVC